MALRRKNRTYNLLASIPTTLLGAQIGLSQFASLEMEPTDTIMGLEPVYALGAATLGCIGLGWLCGPIVGTQVYKLTHRKLARAMEAKEKGESCGTELRSAVQHLSQSASASAGSSALLSDYDCVSQMSPEADHLSAHRLLRAHQTQACFPYSSECSEPDARCRSSPSNPRNCKLTRRISPFSSPSPRSLVSTLDITLSYPHQYYGEKISSLKGYRQW